MKLSNEEDAKKWVGSNGNEQTEPEEASIPENHFSRKKKLLASQWLLSLYTCLKYTGVHFVYVADIEAV